MAALTTPKVTQVTNALTAALQTISHRQAPTTWQTTPVKVVSTLFIGDLTMSERPVLSVAMTTWQDAPAALGGLHRATGHWEVTAIVDKDDDAASQLDAIMADVVKAVGVDEQLGNVVERIYPIGYSLDVEGTLRNGLGIGIITFEATYQWLHSAP